MKKLFKKCMAMLSAPICESKKEFYYLIKTIKKIEEVDVEIQYSTKNESHNINKIFIANSFCKLNTYPKKYFSILEQLKNVNTIHTKQLELEEIKGVELCGLRNGSQPGTTLMYWTKLENIYTQAYIPSFIRSSFDTQDLYNKNKKVLLDFEKFCENFKGDN